MTKDDKEKIAGDLVPTLDRTDSDELDGYVLTPEEDTALKRKADLHLLPILCLGYFLQFVSCNHVGDKADTSSTKLP